MRGERQSRRPRRKAAFCLLAGLLGLLMWETCLEAQAAGSFGGTDEAAQEGTASYGQEPDLSLLEELDFSELDEALAQEETLVDFDFRGLVEDLISGEELDKGAIWDSLKKFLLREIIASRNYMVQIVLLAAAFALLYNFANVSENAAVTDISFYMVYMALLALLMKSFLLMSDTLVAALQRMMDVMKALIPAFTLTMIFSTGTVTAMGVYQLTMAVIFLIEAVLLYGMVPAVQIYVVLELMNYLTKEELISRLTELIQQIVEWVLKFLFTLVVGINVVQGLLNPVIDSFKNSALARTASMLPGVGNSVRAVADLMVGSGIIIKNAVGTAGIVVVSLLCVGPLLKVGVMTLMYKLAAAVVQPVADNRISGCIAGVGEGARLFGKIMVTAQIMLLLTIALVTAATTWNR